MTKDLSNRQIEIIEASGKILMQKGILGLTTKNLAAEMGFSESALYRHFKSKDAIILLLIQFLAANVNERFETIVNTDKQPDEKLKALFSSQFTFFKTNPHFLVIILSDGIIDFSEDVKKNVMGLIQLNFQTIEKVIKDGQDSGLFVADIPTKDLVHIVGGALRLTMFRWKMSGYAFDLEKEGISITNSVLKLMYKRH
jgi:TetR/AcrR family transcriptional regulator, fatty acid metabolism regulator protein